MDIKAIETVYKGYRFRSRLEARWAVFFDALGVKWEYEKEGYSLGDAGWYLPDFWLPDLGVFVEIKPSDMSPYEHRRVLALRAQASVILICGEPGNYAAYDYTSPYATLCADIGVWGKSGEHVGFGYRCSGEFTGYLPRQCSDRDSFNGRDKGIGSAVTAARSARFEHGESPQI